MATRIEKLSQEYRSVTEDEVAEYFRTLVPKLWGRNQESINLLRQLPLLMLFKGDEITISKDIIDLLTKILGEKSAPARLKQHCQMVLQMLCPCDQIATVKELDASMVSTYLQLAPCQGKADVKQLISQAVRWATTVGFDQDVQQQAILFLFRVASDYRTLLSSEQKHVISSQLTEWLRHASTHQAPNPHKINPFKKADNVTPVNELDGSVAREFFTVLNIGQYYTVDQYMNIHSFSSLLSWLRSTEEDADSRRSSVTSEHGDHQRNSLNDACVDYCIRIIDQWEKKAKVPHDTEVQHAAVLEALAVLDRVCKSNPTFVPKVMEAMKRLYAQISHDSSHAQILLRILQVFLNHSEVVMYDSHQAFEFFFGQVLSETFSNSAVAFDTVMFIYDNLEQLCCRTTYLQKYFPNILKILAFSPRTFLAEFIDIIPAMMSSTTVSEVLHTLLDLPCMSATMQVIEKCQHLNENSAVSHSVADMSAIEAYRNPLYKPLFNFIMRSEGGHGDTIDRLDSVHRMLQNMSKHPKVLCCAQVIPVVLRVYFKIICQDGDLHVAGLLLPLILERAGLLYDIMEFKHDVLKIFSDSVVKLFKLNPKLLMEQQAELLDFVSSLRNVNGKEDFFVHLVLVIGDYSSASFDSRCTPEIVSQFYEALECLAYEISGLVGNAMSENEAPYSVRLIMVLMSTLTKLASRCQDLIPRVLLCLTKLSQHHTNRCLEQDSQDILMSRATELISLLKLPNVAPEILSPPPAISTGRWHTDNTSLPVLLHTMTDMVQQK